MWDDDHGRVRKIRLPLQPRPEDHDTSTSRAIVIHNTRNSFTLSALRVMDLVSGHRHWGGGVSFFDVPGGFRWRETIANH